MTGSTAPTAQCAPSTPAAARCAGAGIRCRASPDYHGFKRPGDNKWANSVVALRATTGELAWGFQLVHHDLWDYDTAAPPLLATLQHDGKSVPVVIQGNKTGFL